MEGGALSDKEFPAFSEKVIPFLHITTRIEGKAHDGLLKEKGFPGFPSLAFLDAEGNVLAQPQGRTVAVFESTLKALNDYLALKKRLDAGEEGLEYPLFVAEWDLGKMDYEEAQVRAKKLGKLTEEQQARVASILIDGEVLSLPRTFRNEETKKASVARVLELHADKYQPSERAAGAWYASLRATAEATEDADLLDEVIAWYQEKYGDNPGIRIQSGRGKIAHYGLPVEPQPDRHRWFFSTEEAAAFFRGQERRRAGLLTIVEMDAILKPRWFPVRALRRMLHPVRSAYLNRYAHTIACVFAKQPAGRS